MNPSAYTRPFTSRASQRGLSLIELMISITIGLLILSALATLFVNQSKTRTELDKSNRLIDNGRYALEVLSEDLRLAGFYGERNLVAAGVINDPCTTTPTDPSVTEMRDALGLHVAGYDASGLGVAIASPPCGLTTTPLATANLKNGSDILVLRRADTTAIPAASVSGTHHYIQLSNCKYDLATSVISKTSSDFNLRKHPCNSTSTLPAANVRRFFVQTYFVSPNNIAGDGIPTLKLKELDPAGTGVFVITPLVEGIEFLQVDYGIDGDNNADGVMDDINGDSFINIADTDGVADSYVTTCATAVCWSNIVSVKLWIIARNIETTVGYTNTNTYTLGLAGTFGPFNDSYKRHVYTQTVRLVNPSSRRETP